MVNLENMSQEKPVNKGHLEVENLSVSFKRKGSTVHVFDEINFTIHPNEFICILGPSGCGKSTILNVIAQFVKQTRGYVFVNRREVDSPGPDRGFVFQQNSLFPWKTVFQNVEFGLKIRGMKKAKRKELVNDYLGRVGLYKYRYSYPHQLSGGMQQRASIIRALVNFPSILLMDEPFGALDAQTRQMMQELLLRIWNDYKSTVIFVTHDIGEAILLGDKIYVMGVNPGRIKEEITIPLERPRHLGMMHSPQFMDLNRQVFQLIREETLKSMDFS